MSSSLIEGTGHPNRRWWATTRGSSRLQNGEVGRCVDAYGIGVVAVKCTTAESLGIYARFALPQRSKPNRRLTDPR